jgi:hypothetical protein
MMILKSILILCISLLFFCTLFGQEAGKNTIKKHEEIINKEHFKQFWKSFINAVKLNDTTQMAKYTRDQIDVYGFLDEDPHFKLKGKTKFECIYNVYKSFNECYDEKMEKSIDCDLYFNSAYIINKEYIENDKFQRVANFCFELNKNGNWQLYLVYDDTTKFKKKSSKNKR